MRGADGVAARPPARGLRAALVAHLDSRQVSRVVYGAIVGLAVVAALEAHPPAPATVAALLASTALAVALAELYSELLGTRVRLRGPVGEQRRERILADVVAVAAGASFPAVYFVLAAAGVIKADLAFTLAKWSGLGLIAAYGFVAARLGGVHLRGSILQALAVAAIGGLVIALKALVH
jgi:hypothetical protein